MTYYTSQVYEGEQNTTCLLLEKLLYCYSPLQLFAVPLGIPQSRIKTTLYEVCYSLYIYFALWAIREGMVIHN